MKVLVKHKKSTLLSVIVLMVLTICITVGNMGDEKSKIGYTVYKSKSAITHINQLDLNISTPKNYLRYFQDSSNMDVQSEMNARQMDFVCLSPNYEIISEYYFLNDFSSTDEELINERIKSTQNGFEIEGDINHDTVTLGDMTFHRVKYARKEMAYLYYDVIVDYFLEHDGKCIEIRNYSEYDEVLDFDKEFDYVASEVEPYLSNYSYQFLILVFKL